MHKTRPDGTLISSACDFCAQDWNPAGTELVIEGHQGSLICTRCLTIAFASLVHAKLGEDQRGKGCTLCLEERDQPQWQSPVRDEARACLRCIRQAASAMENDEESGWTKPAPSGA